jgi:hypothetical protein
MSTDPKREEDQEKLAEENEREERIREESEEGSFFSATEREFRREMQEKSPTEAVRDDLKATKEVAKEWLERDDSEADSGSTDDESDDGHTA